MKKILLIFFLFLFSFTIYAKESRIGIKIYTIDNEIKCNNKKVHVVNYNYDTNELIVSENYSEDSSEYYIINDKNECKSITNNDWLKLYNSTQKKYSTYVTDYNEELEDSSFALIEYKSKVGLVSSYILNENEYDKTKKYYEIVDNSITEVNKIDKDKIYEYYIKVKLINVSSEKLDKNKSYYMLDEETGLYKKITDYDVNILDVYEVTNDSIETLNAYSKSEAAASRLLNKYKKSDNDQVIINIILDELYYGIFFYDEENNLIGTKYYGDYYNEIKDFENKIFYNFDEYLIASNLKNKEYYIYDKKFNLINVIRFSKRNDIEAVHNSNEKLFITFKDEDNNFKSYSINCKTNKYFYVLVFFDIVIVLLFVYLIIKRKKYKNKIEVFEEKRLDEFKEYNKNRRKKSVIKKKKK